MPNGRRSQTKRTAKRECGPDADYELRFTEFFDRADIQGYYSASGEPVGGMRLDSEYSTADLPYRLCQYYHTCIRDIPASSRVYDLYGNRRSGDGSVVLTINPDTYGGYYQIERVTDDGVYVSITRSSGNIDYRVLSMSEDLSTLYVFKQDEMWDAGDFVGSFSHVG